MISKPDSPRLTASLRFPLAPKEETWAANKPGAAFGLILR